MSAAGDLQDRRRVATRKVEERMVAMLVAGDARFAKLTVEAVREIAQTASNYAWDALVEVAS